MLRTCSSVICWRSLREHPQCRHASLTSSIYSFIDASCLLLPPSVFIDEISTPSLPPPPPPHIRIVGGCCGIWDANIDNSHDVVDADAEHDANVIADAVDYVDDGISLDVVVIPNINDNALLPILMLILMFMLMLMLLVAKCCCCSALCSWTTNK